MVVELKFCKFDDTPWGFRLVGGVDFEIPLTVAKITEESLAEKAGLRVGDIVVRINDIPTSQLTHNDAHNILMHAGNLFMLGLKRDEPQQLNITATSTATANHSSTNISSLNGLSVSPIKRIDMAAYDVDNNQRTTAIQLSQDNNNNITDNDNGEITQRITDNMVDTSKYNATVIDYDELVVGVNRSPSSEQVSIELELADEPDTDQVAVDEQIAEIMSGEAEVLKEHNVIGVNFRKIMPQSGKMKQSDVLKQLNEEAIKTKEEMDKEHKKMSTFLQKPNRPIPKSKKELAIEKARGEPYLVRIVKQPKPKVDPSRTPTPPLLEEPCVGIAANSCDANNSEKIIEALSEIIAVDNNQMCALNQSVDATDSNCDDDDYGFVNGSAENDVINTVKCINNATVYENDKDRDEDDANVDAHGHCDVSVEHNNSNTNNDTNNYNNNDDSDAAVPKTAEELAFEQKLNAVQRQLAELSHLPFTIQSALDTVAQQIANLIPQVHRIENGCAVAKVAGTLFAAEQRNSSTEMNGEQKCSSLAEHSTVTEDDSADGCADARVAAKTINATSAITTPVHGDGNDDAMPSEFASMTTTDGNSNGNPMNAQLNATKQIAVEQQHKREVVDNDDHHHCERQMQKQKQFVMNNNDINSKDDVGDNYNNGNANSNELTNSKQKNYDKVTKELEHQQRLIRERTPHRPPRSFGPLVPQERPIFLPGGRRWRNPKDAYNDEFIAEILSSQAELITGTTLGSSYESPLLGYDDRVNFLKYQKPEKKCNNLESSEVFRLVHNMEREPKHGIQVRPEKVAAEEDIVRVRSAAF